MTKENSAKTFARALALSCFLTCFFALPADAQQLTLARDGVSLAPIVVFDDAPLMTRQAADELAEYIQKASGAMPEVVEGRPDPLPKHAIWVGYQPVLDELFPDLDFDFEHPEEILIAANDSHLVIAGRDRWDPENMTVRSRGGRVVTQGVQQEYGTVNAVYTFLQEHLGVRWLWPGDLGEDVLETNTISFPPFEHRHHPQIRQRNTILRFSSRFWSNSPHSGDWARVQRLQLDSMNAPIQGHGFSDWWSRFHEEHPDYFALQPDGTRSGFPGPGTVKLCQSNPAVWERFADEVAEKLKEDPTQTVFNASPNDSYNRGICVCQNCLAWDHPDAVKTRYSWQGLSQEYVAMSDRYVTFANHLGRKLKERFPDRDLYVMMYAYGSASCPAPVEAKPDENVIICGVHNFHLSKPAYRDPAKRQFADWSKTAPYLLWRPNVGGTVGWTWAMPDISMKQAIGDFKFLAGHNCVGISFDSTWQHWSTQGPHYYMMAQMAWNPSADGWAILDDYYRRGFGPAGEKVKAYWTLMEDIRDRLANDPKAQRFDIPRFYTPETLAQANSLLEQAAEEVKDAPERYLERVRFLQVGFEFTRRVVRIRQLMERVEKSGGEDTDAADLVEAEWKEFDRMAKEHPDAMNWSRIYRTHRWQGGLYPR